MNEHINEYLEYYCNLDLGPEYAVLLRGNWGSGKSWLMRGYMDNHDRNQFLYVSLYGVSSFSDIEDAFFSQLHPLLAHKGMKIAGKLLKGVLKTTIKIDLDDAKKDSLTLAGGLPAITLPDFLTKLDGKILVFDDLERCALPIHQVLGYINQYVENNGSKVIILANEDEIIQTDEAAGAKENAKRYLTIKEKLIGKSFDIQADYEGALEAFIRTVQLDECRNYLTEQKWHIQIMFLMGRYGNLRHLRQSMLEYERLYRLLSDEVKASVELMRHLLLLFMSTAFELKSGSIHEGDIIELLSYRYNRNKNDDSKNRIEVVRQKYPILKDTVVHPVTPGLWQNLFCSGTVDREKLNLELHDSVYLSPEEQPVWKKLYFFTSLSDQQFQNLYAKLLRVFDGGEINNPYEVVQITAVFVCLIDLRLIIGSKEAITDQGLSHLKRLAERGFFNFHQLKSFPDDHSHGLGYMANGDPVFEDFLKTARILLIANERASKSDRAAEVLKLLQESVQKFKDRLNYDDPENAGYVRASILQHVNPDDFNAALLAHPSKMWIDITDTLESRYSYGYRPELLEEKQWLRDLYNELEKHQSTSDLRTIKDYLRDEKVLPSIKRCIVTLDQHGVPPKMMMTSSLRLIERLVCLFDGLHVSRDIDYVRI